MRVATVRAALRVWLALRNRYATRLVLPQGSAEEEAIVPIAALHRATEPERRGGALKHR
jgi:hypothetical protein